MRKFIFGLVVVSLLVTASAIVIRDEQDVAALDAARTIAADPIIQLDLGSTRYRIEGPDDGPTVVLIHSFNGYLESWEPNVKALTDAGYRVLRYDLWGRGLSARPDVDLSLAVFRKQLRDLLAHLGGGEQVSLVGASFGCVIAADYAQNYPKQVSHLVLMGPAGWPTEGFDAASLLSIPVLGDAVFGYFGQQLLRPRVRAYFRDPSSHAWALEIWERYAAQPGSNAAALSTLRHSPVKDFTAGWKALGELNAPTLFVWGKQDVSFPYSNAQKAKALVPHAKIVAVDDAAHWVNIEQAERSNAALLAFLGQ